MNKKLLIGVAAIVILALVGIGGFMLVNNSKTTPSTAVTPQQTTANTNSATNSLKDLIASQTPQQCSFKDTASGNSGSVFIANAQMRGNFTTTGPQGNVGSHMIVKDNSSYIWMDGQTSGFKMSFDAQSLEDSVESIQNSFDVNQQLDYNCSNWGADASVFVLPSEIEFTDYSSMMAPQVPGL